MPHEKSLRHTDLWSLSIWWSSVKVKKQLYTMPIKTYTLPQVVSFRWCFKVQLYRAVSLPCRNIRGRATNKAVQPALPNRGVWVPDVVGWLYCFILKPIPLATQSASPPFPSAGFQVLQREALSMILFANEQVDSVHSASCSLFCSAAEAAGKGTIKENRLFTHTLFSEEWLLLRENIWQAVRRRISLLALTCTSAPQVLIKQLWASGPKYTLCLKPYICTHTPINYNLHTCLYSCCSCLPTAPGGRSFTHRALLLAH